MLPAEKKFAMGRFFSIYLLNSLLERLFCSEQIRVGTEKGRGRLLFALCV
jgi:hypothetical protein